jgi:hypothetical protein
MTGMALAHTRDDGAEHDLAVHLSGLAKMSCEVGDVVLVDASMAAGFTGANAGSFGFLRLAATQILVQNASR